MSCVSSEEKIEQCNEERLRMQDTLLMDIILILTAGILMMVYDVLWKKCLVSVPERSIGELRWFTIVQSDIELWSVIECIVTYLKRDCCVFLLFIFLCNITFVTNHWFRRPVKGVVILLPFRLTENTSPCYFYWHRKAVLFHQVMVCLYM